ncbi:MAG TPA: hypothetical protein VNX26_08060 [Candidatus Acidoferrum sp.]|jgi:hypothetical protein|nr:hypothetical protein [Candidatus Acidoferrum sp.]
MPTTTISRAARWGQWIFLAIALCFFSSVARTQTPDSQSAPGNQSWTATTDLNSNNANPIRTTASHTQSGNRTLDTNTLQRRGSNGEYEPYQDIETETVKVNSTTVRTITRTFGRDTDGHKNLVQVKEEETRSQPGGDSSVTRVVSNPDANGRLQPVQREIAITKKIGKDVEETKTTVMLPGINGDLAPAMQVQERRQRGANDTVDTQKTMSIPDGSGNWQVNETRHATTRQDGNSRNTEERISRLDPNGKLTEVSRTVSKESESAPGEKRNTTEVYSLDVPGSARDGSLHLVQRETTAQRTSSTGQQTTQHQVEQPDPGNPDSGLRVTVLTTDTLRPGSSGSRTTRTIQALDPNGSLTVVSVDTTKSDNTAVQVQIAPPEKKK